jgi:hypothetical protein
LLGQVEAIKSHGMFFLANTGDRKLATCATRDIAAAGKLLPDDSWSGPDSIPVLGPDDLSPRSWHRSRPRHGRTLATVSIFGGVPVVLYRRWPPIRTPSTWRRATDVSRAGERGSPCITSGK